MDGNNIIEPQPQVGKIVRQDFLDFSAGSSPFFLIHLHTSLVRQRVDARTAVMPAIGAVGRKTLRRKRSLKKVVISVSAYPPLKRKLEIPFGDVRKQRRECR